MKYLVKKEGYYVSAIYQVKSLGNACILFTHKYIIDF